MSALMEAPGASPASGDVSRLGMWLFLASEVLFFGVLLFVYAIARHHAPQGFAAASARTDVWLGTLNTALLLSSSAAVALAAEASACGRPIDTRRGLWIAAALGLAFLAIKGAEYRKEWVEHLVPGSGFALREVPGAELFFAWYFFATALHALHLIIGIVLCSGFARRVSPTPNEIHALALYWHFVDVVWIPLYPLIYLVSPR